MFKFLCIYKDHERKGISPKNTSFTALPLLYRLLIGEIHRTIEMCVRPVRVSHRASSEPRPVVIRRYPSPDHKPTPRTHSDIASHLTGLEPCFSTIGTKTPQEMKECTSHGAHSLENDASDKGRRGTYSRLKRSR